VLSFSPRLPSRIARLEFSLLWRGLRLRVSVRAKEVTYFLREGDHEDGSKVELLHHGEPVTVTIGNPVTRPIPEPPVPGPEPEQPPGRAPVRRSYFVPDTLT
jgi:alpha,alpha-trehalose phosphorylase